MKIMYKIIIISIISIFFSNSLFAFSPNTIKLLDPKVTIFQGKANYNFPILAPMNIMSISPILGVNYTSQTKNDIFGLDTKLSGLSSINRCGEKPLFTDNDAFCYNEDVLVKVKNTENQYVLIKDPSIKFIKQGDKYWEMHKPNGNIVTFGKDDLAKIFIKYETFSYFKNSSGHQEKYKYTNKTGTITWNISDEIDKNNNTIKYNYSKISDVPYISSINYANNKIDFTYENRNDSAPIKLYYSKGLFSILKTDSGGELKYKYPNNELFLYRRLQSIKITENNAFSHSYKFHYEYGQLNSQNKTKSLLSKISYCDNSNLCLNPIILKYENYLDTTSTQILNNDNSQLNQIQLLSIVSNNFDVKKEIQYKFLDNKDILKEDNIYNVAKLSIQMPNSSYKTISYNYLDHKYIDKNHNYATITKHDSLTDILTTTSYSQKKESLNEKLSENKQIGDKILIQSNYKYRIITEPNSNIKRALIENESVKSFDLNGKYISTENVAYSYDKFDNITKRDTSVESSNSNYSHLNITQYLNNTNEWIINKPILITNTTKLNSNEEISITNKYIYNNKAMLIKKTLALGKQEELTNSYEYNQKGFLIKSTILDRTSSIKYDQFNRIIKKVNALGQVISLQYAHPICTTNATSITNINNQTISYKYDNLCKVVKTIEENGRSTETFYDNESDQINIGIDYQNIGFNSHEGLNSIYSITDRTNTGLWNKKYINMFGKVIRSVNIGYDSKKTYTDIIYNNKNLVKAKTIPYFKGGIIDNVNFIQYEYDALNRLIVKTKPSKNGKMITSFTYDAFTTIITNPNKTKKNNSQRYTWKYNQSIRK